MPEDTSTPLTLPVELTEKDVVLAHFWTLFQIPLIRLLVAVNGLLLLGFILLALRAATRGDATPTTLVVGAIALALFFVVVPLRVRSKARRHFRSLTEAERRGAYTFTREGFAWTLGRVPGSTPWTAVTRSHETDAHIFLMTRSLRTHVLPKARSSEREIARLREMWPSELRASLRE